jgi:hypothetical protein
LALPDDEGIVKFISLKHVILVLHVNIMINYVKKLEELSSMGRFDILSKREEMEWKDGTRIICSSF